MQRAGCGERHNHSWRHRGTARCDTADRTVTSELSVANGERNHLGRGTTYLRVAYTSVARLQRVQWHCWAEYGCHHRELHARFTGIHCKRSRPVFVYEFFYFLSDGVEITDVCFILYRAPFVYAPVYLKSVCRVKSPQVFAILVVCWRNYWHTFLLSR